MTRQNTTQFLARPQFERINRVATIQLVSSFVSVIAILLVAFLSFATFTTIQNGIVVEADFNTTELLDVLNEIKEELTAQTEAITAVEEAVAELDAAFDLYATEATAFWAVAEAELLDISVAADITAVATASLDAAFFIYSAQFSDFSRDILCQNDCVGCTRLCDLSKDIIDALELQTEDLLSKVALESTLKERATEATLKAKANESTSLLILESASNSEETLERFSGQSFGQSLVIIDALTAMNFTLLSMNTTQNATLIPIRDTQSSISRTADLILSEISNNNFKRKP